MLKTSLCIVALSCLSAAHAADEAAIQNNKTAGDASAGKIVVDTAPGTVSAMSTLGLGAEQTTVVQNPRNLTVAVKALDGSNAFGLAITPARTSLVPLNISTYNDNFAARVWAGTTFSYAQSRAETGGKEFDRRAFAVETSFFFFPHLDDPLVRYWDALEEAGKTKDEKNNCLLMLAVLPGQNDATGSTAMVDDPVLTEATDKRAKACREKVEKAARWNASRAWASWAGGSYKSTTGGDSHSLGHTGVLGATWGLGSASSKTAAAITVAAKRTSNSPVLKTLGDLNPVRKSTNLAVLRVAVGSPTIRALLEASNVRNEEPTATSRTLKRALGIEVRVAEGMWVNLRTGKQRRIDNTGDENTSAFNISYSPKAILEL